jgi:hypothetical protein
MRKLSIAWLALAVCLMFSGTAVAKDNQGNKGNKGGSHGNSAEHGHGHGDADDSRPPGWDKGKKTGWGDCDVPPGQAKKQGCNSTPTSVHHHHHYDRDRKVHHRYGTHHTYTRHSSTSRPRTTTRTTTTTQGTHNQGSNSAIILQRNGGNTVTTRTTTNGATPRTGSQLKDQKPAANPR